MARIMIADDSILERSQIRDFLNEMGHETLEAEDGEEAENKFFAQNPDLLILDVVMPKQNGYQLCRNIKQQKQYRKTPIIMISSKNRLSDKYWGLQQGADNYLFKPVDKQTLLDLVTKHLTPNLNG